MQRCPHIGIAAQQHVDMLLVVWASSLHLRGGTRKVGEQERVVGVVGVGVVGVVGVGGVGVVSADGVGWVCCWCW